MELKERLMQFISYKRKTVQAFECEVGLSNGAVGKMGNNTRRSTLDKISNIYPELNTTWLLTGEGEMLKTNGSAIASGDGSVAVSGNNNRNVVAGNETVLLQERIHHLEELVSEKERLIQILMEGRK